MNLTLEQRERLLRVVNSLVNITDTPSPAILGDIKIASAFAELPHHVPRKDVEEALQVLVNEGLLIKTEGLNSQFDPTFFYIKP